MLRESFVRSNQLDMSILLRKVRDNEVRNKSVIRVALMELSQWQDTDMSNGESRRQSPRRSPRTLSRTLSSALKSAKRNLGVMESGLYKASIKQF